MKWDNVYECTLETIKPVEIYVLWTKHHYSFMEVLISCNTISYSPPILDVK